MSTVRETADRLRNNMKQWREKDRSKCELSQEPCLATPREQLIRELMDSCVPKSEREWCAAQEIEDMLTFIREQVEMWDNDGDSGFPSYDHGKQILARYKSPNNKGQP